MLPPPRSARCLLHNLISKENRGPKPFLALVCLLFFFCLQQHRGLTIELWVCLHGTFWREHTCPSPCGICHFVSFEPPLTLSSVVTGTSAAAAGKQETSEAARFWHPGTRLLVCDVNQKGIILKVQCVHFLGKPFGVVTYRQVRTS